MGQLRLPSSSADHVVRTNIASARSISGGECLRPETMGVDGMQQTSPAVSPHRARTRRRRFGRLSLHVWITALATLLVVVSGVARATGQEPAAVLQPFGWWASWDERIYQPGMDYDKDGCYPVAAI